VTTSRPIRSHELTPGTDYLPLRDCSWLYVVGRLKPGVRLKQAQAEMSLVAGQSDRNGAVTEYPERKTNVIVASGALLNSPEVYKKGAPLAALLMAAVGLVLLIACANVSNLLLARAVTRQKEVGVRLALGASRGRLVRQLLTESLLLALLSGAGGLAFAYWLPRVFLLGLDRSLNFDFSPNLTVLGYSFLVSLGAGVVFGLAPALDATKLDLISALKAEGTMISSRFSRSRLRNLLVVIQVTVSLLLLTGAGLLARGLHRAQSTDLGFEPGDYVVIKKSHAAFTDTHLDRLLTNLGVETCIVAGGGVEDSIAETARTGGRLGYERNRRDFAKFIWQTASPKWAFDDATFNRSAAAFDNPDQVSIVVHNYRWRLGLAEGEPKYDDLEKRLALGPVIAVPTSVGYGASFGGIAALLGMLNSCANGVAVVNIDNGFGAAAIASLINHQ